MIDVTIYKSKNYHMGFKAFGHAGMAEFGQDIVCASASILMINTINALDEFTEDGFTNVSDETNASIELLLKTEPSKEADLLLKTMVLGLRSIDEEYEEYINISFEEV